MIPEAVVAFYEAQPELLWVMTVGLDLACTLLLYRYFGKMGLYTTVILNILFCNLIGIKVTQVFGINTSMGVILYSGIYFATDLLSERYGKREAHRAVMLGFGASILLVLFGTLGLLYAPTPDPDKQAFAATVHGALSTLFNLTPRFVFGSLFAYYISQTHDVWMFHFMKRLTKGRYLWLRNNVSTITSQGIDTTLYAFVVWWGIFDLATAIELSLAKYFFKVLIALLDTPFIYWARTWDVSKQDWADGPESTETYAKDSATG